jgi:dehydrogenase/reductase SDR family member 12
MTSDLGLMSDTAALVKRLEREGLAVDVLVNNVGALIHAHALTAEGKESSYALNILNHFLLTEGLIEKGLLKRGGTVINMSSGGMYNAPLLVEKMNVTDATRYNGVFAYAVHKRGQAELTKYWQAAYGTSHDLRFYVMHPGWTDTEGVQTAMPRFRRILRLVLRDGLQGGDTAIWLAAQRPDADPAGFWFDRKPRDAHAYDATRVSKHTPADLAAFLRQEITPAQGS